MNSGHAASRFGRRFLQCAFAACFAAAATGVVAQSNEDWQPPRTSSGHPDMQGYWTNTTVVPLQRPEELGTKAFYTAEEAEARLRDALQINETEPGTTADVHYQLDDYALDRSQNPVARNRRTSILTDPPNGRLPEPTAEGRAIQQARDERRREHGFDSVKERPLAERCIVWPSEGPPMMPIGYNSNYQIMQNDDHFVVVEEMIHDARIIPFENGEHLPAGIGQWLGDSVGHWEGDTLVVETTNFTGRTRSGGMPVSRDAHVTERFTLTSDDTIRYEFTVDDPTIWTKPWSGEYPMVRIEGPIFEYACNEGNYGLPNTLSGARADERKAAAGKN